jgi:uncharacterized glyoxalase superfamily protein PhnB
VSWLCRVFGFTEQWRFEPGGSLLMANLGTPGGGGVMVSTLDAAAGPPAPNPYYSVTVMVPDVDAHAARARAEGAELVSEPADQPWGFRDYEVLDLAGRQWNFSQHLHDVTPEDWGASTPG